MTSPENSSNTTPPGYEGIGVSEEKFGSILQRGGEELKVEKIPNRFTVQLSNGKETITNLSRSPISLIYRTNHPPQFEEIEVAPDQLDAAMELVRQSDQVVFASHVYRVENDPGMIFYLSDQVTIQFDQSVDEERRDSITSPLGLEYLKPIDGVENAFVYRVTSQATENPLKISNYLKSNPEVLVAEPNIIVHSQSYYRPNDPLYNKQWYLHHNGGSSQLTLNSHIHAEQAWNITRGLRSVVVAITDDGVDLNHPDFQGLGKIVAPLDLKGRDSLPMPEAASDNHGTACAGVAIAEENGYGVVGVAPGCALMPIRTTGYLDDESVEQIFNWGIQRGASVISCSWGASAVHFPLSLRQSAVLTKAARQGRKGKGCVIVFAAGNANRPINGILNEQGWPNNMLTGQVKWLAGFAVHPDVIAVSACNSLNQKSAYSNWGTGVSVCAPSNNAPPGMWLPETGYIGTPPTIRTSLQGLGIFTTDRLGAAGYDPGDFTPYFGGTSSATPVVAGVAALILSVNPDLTAQDVRRILEQTADKIVDPNPDPQLGIRMGNYDSNGYSQCFGYGKVNAYQAVKMAQSQRVTFQKPSRRRVEVSNQILEIPDNQLQGIQSPIVVSETAPLQDIQITLEIEHQFLGDLEIWLISPNNEKVLLQNRMLGRQTQLNMTYSLQTTPYLRQCLNVSPQGRWHLLLVDCAPGHTGKLKQWKLDLGF